MAKLRDRLSVALFQAWPSHQQAWPRGVHRGGGGVSNRLWALGWRHAGRHRAGL